MMTMWGQEHKLKMTCCEFHIGLNGHLPPGLARRVVTVKIMSCARALISADGINWMKPLPLCLHCRRLRGTAVFVCYSTQGADIPFACTSVKLNVNIWMRDVLWLLTWVSWAHRSVTSDFDTYYPSASGCFLFLCRIYVWFGPCGQLLDFCLHSSLFSSATELSAGSLSL